MGYQALLFCPDEKTARTVTQVLSELEFSVEACIEPFAAVKKLMGEHFDAVVVDCDNEQNATLLFKSARNSTSNQTSLAVAVVEGQAGVAKAFRIGANLVLTKPINIEQTKGTLRVARGLLRKADPTKPAAAATTAPSAPSATPATTAKPALKPVSVAKPPVPPARVVTAPPVQKIVPAAKPVPPAVLPATAAATTKTEVSAKASDLFEKPAEKPARAPIEAPPSKPESVNVSFEKAPEPPAPAAPVVSASLFSSSGAASAPAPAREAQAPKIAEPIVESASPAPAKAVSEPTPIAGSAPTFSYGATSAADSGGASKKIFIGIAAAVLIAVGGYFGFTHFKGNSSGDTGTPAATTQSAAIPAQPAKSNLVQPATPTPVETPRTSSSAANVETTASEPAPREIEARPTPKPERTSVTSSAAPSKPSAAEEQAPESAPLFVKGGKAPAAHAKPAAAEATQAPSMIGIASSASAPPPDLVPTSSPSFKPVLQTLSVSQGVSQGLLYKKVAPNYPQAALRMRIEGKVELMATISKDGNITQVKILSGEQQLARAASDAVKQWKYKPYLLNGEPVEIQTQVTVNFKLPN